MGERKGLTVIREGGRRECSGREECGMCVPLNAWGTARYGDDDGDDDEVRKRKGRYREYICARDPEAYRDRELIMQQLGEYYHWRRQPRT